MVDKETAMAVAYFAAGCFWGVETAFRKVDGVRSTSVGYMGGTQADPTYEDVCTGTTGHAETVRVEFDPAAVGYEDLLEMFWKIHDPTQGDRQGPDVGTQYRSVLFPVDFGQTLLASASRERVTREARFARPVTTDIVDAGHFWLAEDYHQQYEEKRRGTRG